jgi:predicted pyridoxine 5'-phosphate oxidase superfamily flavin-nucleotide-binding protein
VGRTYDAIAAPLRRWLAEQPMFFVATAPNDAAGHVNLSPKGGEGTFQVLGPTTVAYVDFVGSGVETAAHLRENGRIVLMFNAFSGPPKIVRFHGRGRVLAEDSAEFAALLPTLALPLESRRLVRGIVVVEVERISDSCGFGVPRMEVVAERDQLLRWSETQEAKQGPAWKARYMRAKNARSIDGLPGYDVGEDTISEEAVVTGIGPVGSDRHRLEDTPHSAAGASSVHRERL